MGLYADHVLPRLIGWGMGGKSFRRERPKATAGLHGRVLELGFGSGHNLEYYPEEVTEVLAVDPSLTGRKLAAKRIERSSIPVRFVGLDGARVELEDGSVDCALSTWTLCTIPDVEGALAEVRRALVEGGKLHFLEHGLAGDVGVARWQRRMNGIQMRLGGGCQLTRKIDEIVRGAGFSIEGLERFYMAGAPRVTGYLYRGVALPASSAE